MAETQAKPQEEKQRQIIKEMWILFAVSAVFSLLWGWLTSIDAVTWLHLFLLIGAISFNVVAVVHWIMMEMLRHGFKQ